MIRQQESKQTEIERIPKEWEVVSLGEIGKLQYGYTTSAINKNTGIKFLRITDIKDDGQVDWERVPYCELDKSDYLKYSLDVGDILFARIGATTGKTAYVDREVKGVFASYLIRFKPMLKDLNTKFLYHFTQSSTYWIQVHKNKEGQLKKGLNAKILATLKLPLPPLHEQKKIAEVLSTVDKAIEKVDENIEKTERLKKGLMQELLTGRRNTVDGREGRREFKQTEIGRIPKEWEVVELSNLVDIKSGLYFKYSEFKERGIKCLKIDNVGFGKIIWDTVTFLPEDYLNKYPDLLLKVGDIVLALNRPIIDGSLKIGILKENDSPSILYQRVGKIIVQDKKQVDQNYLFCTFSGHYFKRILSKSLVGTDQPYIRTPLLLRLKLPLPPLPEQKKIAEILGTVDKRLELLRKKKEKLQRVKKGLMNDLLTGKRRVKISRQ